MRLESRLASATPCNFIIFLDYIIIMVKIQMLLFMKYACYSDSELKRNLRILSVGFFWLDLMEMLLLNMIYLHPTLKIVFS